MTGRNEPPPHVWAEWKQIEADPGFGDQAQRVIKAIIADSVNSSGDSSAVRIHTPLASSALAQDAAAATVTVDPAFHCGLIERVRFHVSTSSFRPGATVVVFNTTDLIFTETTEDGDDAATG